MQLMMKDDPSSTICVSDVVFNQDYNNHLVHQVVVAYLAGARQGSKSQKNKSDVSGSGKKPWRQKGTGRARVGSIRSPIWRSGGVTFAAKPRSYKQKVNKKMYRGALRSIFSTLIRQNRLLIFKSFTIESPKTKVLISKLHDISLSEVYIIIDHMDRNLFLASSNVHQVLVREVKKLDPVSLLNFKNVIVTVDAIRQIEKILI
ncbi:50S ribosomal protein L4 [Buchnera aphidicola]|uniref:50S ribosomal protein L4 n=1 Tax=Buchnera aphidicola TaxID=9 RepID=UPI0031B8195F